MMENIRPIRTEEDYEWAMAEVTHYFENQPEPGTPDGDRFDLLSDLIEAYEDKHWPIDKPDPIEAISAVLQLKNLDQSYLAEILGSRSRASEILNRKRPLNIAMVQKITEKLPLSADILVQPYHLATEKPAARRARKRA